MTMEQLRISTLVALSLAAFPAAAAVPTLKASGTFGDAPVFQTTVPQYLNLASLNGKSFELELAFPDPIDYLGKIRLDSEGLPGEFLHEWNPGSIHYTLKVDGQVRFTGVSAYTFADAFDDVTVTAAFISNLQPGDYLPPIIQAGGTYDGVLIYVSDIPLGCVGTSPLCNQPGETFEGVALSFEYNWDTAVKNAISGLPGNPYALPADFFTGGEGVLGLSVWRFDGMPGNDIAMHGGLVSNVTLAMPVPEAETYAMMLAGLGLVGFMAARRRA